jgi:ribA/ribD-fused uncharacterized protein
MASGFPLRVNRIHILSAEALYQVCRFPHRPEVQSKILSERSPMAAKMVGKPYRADSRSDWDDVRVMIMQWCLRVKLAQNYLTFGALLESTSDKPIVEESKKDRFWGAIRDKHAPNILVGANVLGQLLTELRQAHKEQRDGDSLLLVKPLDIPEFRLMGDEIGVIDKRISLM